MDDLFWWSGQHPGDGKVLYDSISSMMVTMTLSTEGASLSTQGADSILWMFKSSNAKRNGRMMRLESLSDSLLSRTDFYIQQEQILENYSLWVTPNMSYIYINEGWDKLFPMTRAEAQLATLERSNTNADLAIENP